MSAQVVFIGWKDRDGRHTRRIYLDRVTAIPTYGHLLNCSPSDLSWGDVGFGSAQLAFALLMEVCGNRLTALHYYQSFKRAIIAGLDKHAFCLTRDAIAVWIERQEEIAAQVVPEPETLA